MSLPKKGLIGNKKTMEINKFLNSSIIHHLGILVYDPKPLIDLFQLLGWSLSNKSYNDEYGVQTYFLGNKNHKMQIEFIVPKTNEGLKKQLNKRGNHIHHIAIELDNIEEGIHNLTDIGYKFISKSPVKGYENRDVIFLHPIETKGILVEFIGRSK